MARIRVLISGAGIGGNALAFWLAKLGFFDVTIVERFPELRTTGLQIDLRGPGVDVLRKMGLEAGFREHAAPEVGIALVDKKGKRRAYFPANTTGKGSQGFTSEFEIMRGDMCRLLYGATGKDHIRYLWGASVESFEERQDGGPVAVRFSNGTTEEFDLVVGADGLGSKVRRLMRGATDLASDTSFQPRGDNFVAYFTIKRPIQPSEKGEEYVAKGMVSTGHRFMLTRRHSPDEIQVYLMYHGRSERLMQIRRGDVAEEKKAMEDLFRGAGWITDEILEAMHASTNFYCERQGLVKLPAWSSPSGRVALLGDAAWCMSANGFGTTAAMAGAYVMAGELGRRCKSADVASDAGRAAQLKAALTAYEDILRPYTTKMQKGEEKDNNFMPAGQWGVSLFYALASFAALIRLDTLAIMFMPGEGFTVPDYSDVLHL